MKTSRSSAVAFHNGSMSPIASITGSADFKDLMQRYQSESNGSRLDRPFEVCHENPHPNERPAYYRSFFSFLSTPLRLLLGSRYQQPTKPVPATVLDQDVSILYDSFHALKLADEDAYKMPILRIGLAVPEWLTDAQVCKISDAIQYMGASIQTVEYAHTAALAAHGYEFCRISSDYLECPPSERIMTLEYNRATLTASLIKTPALLWSGIVAYATNNTLGVDHIGTAFPYPHDAEIAITTWISEFVRLNTPERIILLGPSIAHPLFQTAILNPTISSLIATADPAIPPPSAAVLGVARIAKDMLESQTTDCLEEKWCDAIREEADRLAGAATPSARTEL